MSRKAVSAISCIISFSTLNHNPNPNVSEVGKLYYIVSLHQTTTSCVPKRPCPQLYCIVSLHQTTTSWAGAYTMPSCIISFLYIKPQRAAGSTRSPFVVLYRFSTSNHNDSVRQAYPCKCCIISFLYIKPQLSQVRYLAALCCIISFPYIKPQQSARAAILTSCCIISFLYIKPRLRCCQRA